jgi:hypothetical protein
MSADVISSKTPNLATTTLSSIVRTNTVCPAIVVVCRIVLHIPPTPNPSVVGPNTTLDRRYSAQGNRAAAAPTQQHGARRGKHAWRGLSSHGDRPITYRQTPLNAGTRWAPEVSCGEMKGKRTAKAGAVAAAQEGAKKVAVAGAA